MDLAHAVLTHVIQKTRDPDLWSESSRRFIIEFSEPDLSSLICTAEDAINMKKKTPASFIDVLSVNKNGLMRYLAGFLTDDVFPFACTDGRPPCTAVCGLLQAAKLPR